MKLLSLLVCLSLFTLSADAQIAIGPKVGINIANQTGDDVSDPSSTIGLHFGAAAEIGINENLSFQPELLAFQKGSEQKTSGFPDVKGVITYLEIPLLVKYSFGSGEGTSFNINAGPSIGFGMMGKIKVGDQETDIDFDRDELKRTDFSISLGAGVAIPAGSGKLAFDLRWLVGLPTINDSNPELDIKNRTVSIGATYFFQLGE